MTKDVGGKLYVIFFDLVIWYSQLTYCLLWTCMGRHAKGKCFLIQKFIISRLNLKRLVKNREITYHILWVSLLIVSESERVLRNT